MTHAIDSQMIFYVGIATMIIAAVLAVVCVIAFAIGGKRLKKKLEKEYGDPEQYNFSDKRSAR